MKLHTTITTKVTGILLALAMLFGMLPLTVLAADTALSEDIVILYTNDVHTYIDGALSYDVIAAVKEELQDEYRYVLLADAGDHIQGTAYGSMDKGASIIGLMNAAGYDVATLGNHEFDYNMQGCMDAIDRAAFPYISCNFYREADGVRGENVLDSYVLFDCGDEKVAFVGITTPETMSKSTPAYFQDGNGRFLYGIAGGEDGVSLQQDVQKAIDAAEAAGATQVIALGHLGVDPSSSPWTSEETIAGVSGLDAFIDGHSHTVMESKAVKGKDGQDVLLTQTGEYFNRIGMMVIDADTGAVTTDFIECTGSEEGYALTSELYTGTELISSAAVKAIKDDWVREIDDQLGQTVGSAAVTFDNYDSDGNRLVWSRETNSGDFAADALYYLFDDMGLDVDIAVMNGGGIRNAALTGAISYKTCKDMHPFGNVACLQTVTGQQILDMLEWGARHVGAAEDGSFLQVSGITYTVDPTVEDTTRADDRDVWIGGPTAYRVRDVMVYNKDTAAWDALDLNAAYNLAGYNYTLRDLGGGFAMLNGAVNVLDYVMEDYMVLANYISGFDNGRVDAANSPLLEKYPGLLIDYGTINGSGRITVAEAGQEPALWVGGVAVTADNADDVLGDGRVSFDADTNTLTLNGWAYEGEGYAYDAYVDDENGIEEVYTAAIYSAGDITIKLAGHNTLRNTRNDPDSDLYGDGVVAQGRVTFVGDGDLSVFGSYGVDADEGVTVDGPTLHLETTADGIGSFNGDVAVRNAQVTIRTGADGIYAGGGVTITDSRVTIDAATDGIYAFDGRVIIDSTGVGLSAYGPWLEGTALSINAGGDFAIFAYTGLTVDDKLTVAAGGRVGELTGPDYTYGTVVDGEAAATTVVIEPLGYTVAISGLGFDMELIVPAGQSPNDTYCAVYGVEDLSEILTPEREGYIFGGWYTDADHSDGNAFSFDDPVTADVTLYAKWVANTAGGDNGSGDDGSGDNGSGDGGKNDDADDGKDDHKDQDNGNGDDEDKDTDHEDGDESDDRNDGEPSDDVQTGDNSHLALWIALLFISGGVVTGAAVRSKQRKPEKS